MHKLFRKQNIRSGKKFDWYFLKYRPNSKSKKTVKKVKKKKRKRKKTRKNALKFF